MKIECVCVLFTPRLEELGLDIYYKGDIRLIDIFTEETYRIDLEFAIIPRGTFEAVSRLLNLRLLYKLDLVDIDDEMYMFRKMYSLFDYEPSRELTITGRRYKMTLTRLGNAE